MICWDEGLSLWLKHGTVVEDTDVPQPSTHESALPVSNSTFNHCPPSRTSAVAPPSTSASSSMLAITVPSQRKVDGHVRYKIELRRNAELVNVGCEKRFSEVHALKDDVKAALGESMYYSTFGGHGHAFPSKWAPNTAEKLQVWLNNLVKLNTVIK